MSRGNNQRQGGINIPGIILDELKDRDYSNDDRFNQSKKRSSTKQLGRKERRKLQRSDKKSKRTKNKSTENISEREYLKEKINDKIKASNKAKNNKTNKRSSKKEEKEQLPFSSDDELSEGDFDEFDDEDLDEEERKQLNELGNDSEEMDESASDFGSDEIISEEEETADDVMSKLQKLKGKKNKNNKRLEKTDESKSELNYPLPPSERMAMERDEMDMQYYAKKLKLKGKKKISASDEFDAIGGLLEGLEFMDNYGASDEEYGDLALNEGKKSKNNKKDDTKAFSSDDELSEGDFDEFEEGDLGEEEWEQLRELEDDDADSEDGPSRHSKQRPKENPYVAAAPIDSESAAYVPPSLRKKQLQSVRAESGVSVEITKKVKSGLNRLSEANITPIIKSLDELFDKYPRQYVTEIITEQLLQMITQRNRLLDTYIMNFSAIAFALFRLRGLEIGAYFIQSTVESFLQHFERQKAEFKKSKDEDATVLPRESQNIITLLSYAYDFGFVSCKLLYDIIKLFVSEPNILTTELLLRVVAVSGQQIRGDDPFALKDIMSQLLANVKLINSPSPRLQFLMNTMTDLKNNRLKPSVLATDFHPIKKLITSTFKAVSSAAEPLQVSLTDIQNVDTKGKWWLVGASWRGNMTSAFEDENNKGKDSGNTNDKIILQDDLLDDIPDWTQIAKENRMNTDVRRAIFVSVMSAQDYTDAFEKIEKLGLKNKQILEIPRVLLNCLLADSKENGYNQFYALVGMKLCEQHRNLLKSFQFLFWDTVQKYEDKDGSDSEDEQTDDINDEDVRLRVIANQGRFFGTLLGQGMLKLDVFKHVPLISGLTSDGNLFVEVLIYQLFQTVSKRSEVVSKKEGRKNYKYKDENMTSLINSNMIGETKNTILKGLAWFIKNKLMYENYLDSDKTSKAFKRDKRRIEWAVPKFESMVKDIINEGDEY